MRILLMIIILAIAFGFGEIRESVAAQPPVIYPQLGFKTSGVYSGSLVFSDDGSLLAAINGDKSIKILDTTTGRELQTIAGDEHADKIRCLAFFPDNQRIVSGSFDKTAVVWDIATGRQVFKLTGHTDWLANIVVSKDGKLIVTSDRKTARIWDSVAGTLMVTIPYPILKDEYIPPGFEPFIRSIAVTPDSSKLIVITTRGIFIYDIGQRRMVSSASLLDIDIYATSNILGFDKNDDLILGGISEINFVSLDRLNVTRKTKKENFILSYVSPDGVLAVGQSTKDYKTIQVFELLTTRERSTYDLGLNNPTIAYSRARRLAVASDIYNHLKLFDLATGQELHDFSTRALVPNGSSFSPDASKMALSFSMADTNSNHDFYKKIWNLKNLVTEGGYNQTEFFATYQRLRSSSNPQDQENAMKMKRLDEGFVGEGWSGGGGYSDLDELNRCYYQVAWVAPASFGSGSPLVNIYRIDEKDYGNYLMAMDEAARNKLRTVVKQFKAHDQNVTVVAISYKHGYIFTGSEDMTIHLFSYPGTKLIRTFKGHRGAIKSLSISPDGTKLISQAEDYTTRLWDVTSGKELAQFVNFVDGEWVAITPEGYYNTSPNGDKYLNVRVENKVYGIENYRETFFRPDLVKLALSGRSLYGYRTLADVKQPPKVTFVQTPATTVSQEFKMTLRLEEQGGGVGDVRLFLNGSAVMLDSGRSLKAVQKDGSGVIFRNYTLKLSSGSNTIRAIAFNADNSMQSNEAVHQVSAGFASTHKPALHALVIGINDYKNPKLTLQYAVADALLFADTLRKSASGLFGKITVKVLTTRPATTAEHITQELKELKALHPDDLFVLYVASHGVVDDGEYYLVTSNVGLTRTEKLKTDALTQTALKELIANIPTTKKLIVLDTCNAAAAGDAIQLAMLTRGMSEDTAIKILSRAVGSTILSASTSSQEALEGYQGHGLFTWVLAEGLKGKADKAKSGYIKTTDIADYVGEEVPSLAERVFKRAQYPNISMSGQPFPVGKVRR